MRDSRETFVNHAFVAGYPIHHSRSPMIHRYWLKALGLPGSYTRQEIAPADFPAFMEALKQGESRFIGGNVTIPHKASAYQLADRPDGIAHELGAANTLWKQDGKIFATNTDAYGFAANLDARAPGWDNGETAIVFGAGGASRAVVQAIRNRGFKTIHILNRTVERAQELADRFGRDRIFAHPLDALSELTRDANLFVNTTSLGMTDDTVPEVDFTDMSSGALVTDIVYVPLKTPFLVTAERQGLRTVDGLGMLLHQAVPGFETWFGTRPDVTDELRALVIADMDH